MTDLNPVEIRAKAKAHVELLLKKGGSVESAFWHWKKKEREMEKLKAHQDLNQGKSESTSDQNDFDYLLYWNEALISCFEKYFKKQENWSRLNPDTEQTKGLPRVARQEMHEFIERMYSKHFRESAYEYIEIAIAFSDGEDSFSWDDVSKLFANLEMAYDPNFYDTGVGKMVGDSDAEIQTQVDELLAQRQRALAKVLVDVDPSIALRYAELLCEIEKPPGLADVEKRGPFLRKLASLHPPVYELLNQRKAVSLESEKTNDLRTQCHDRYHKLMVLNEAWSQYRIEGIDRLFDLGLRKKAINTVKVMVELGAIGREKAQSQKEICKRAEVNSGNIGSSFSPSGKMGPLCKEFYDLVIKNDGSDRGYYYLDII